MKKLFLFFLISNLSFTTEHIENASRALNELYQLASKKDINEIQFFNDNIRLQWVKSKALKLEKNSKVLDIGAGDAPYRKLFSHCDYKTHDFAINTNHIKYTDLDYVSDITKIPVSDESFDVVLCTEVLEHVPEPIKALQEISRILKHGGKLLLTAPLGSGLHQLPYHFYGGYTPEWYKHFCPKFNLQINEITSNGGLFKLLTQECSRVAWSLNVHKDLHGNQAPFIKWLFNDFLPRYLTYLDDNCHINNFTVGYFVEAQKIVNNKESKFPFDELYNAIKNKNLNIIDKLKSTYNQLIKNKANSNIYNLQDENGYTPLMWAASTQTSEEVKFILENGADINAKDKNECTALMFACWKGNIDAVDILIKNKADIDAIDINGTTAFSLADQLESPFKEKIISLLIGQEI